MSLVPTDYDKGLDDGYNMAVDLVNAKQEQIESLQREKAETEAELKRAYADLESIRRENEELRAAVKQTVTRASCVQCADMEQQIKELRIKLHNQAAKAEEQAFMWRERLEKAEAAAITPEMRERMGALLLAFDEGFLEMEEAALNGINIIRGLLGEQGGPAITAKMSKLEPSGGGGGIGITEGKPKSWG